MKKNYNNILLITIFVFILGISTNVFAQDCEGVLNGEFLDALNKYVYIPIKWGVPILLVILTSVDFAKTVFDGKKESMDKAKNNFLKRFVAAVIIFFAPDVVILLVDLIGNVDIKACIPNFQ